jgi:hypothetical protein
MSIAVCLAGLHYMENYLATSYNLNETIHYKKYLRNMKFYIYEKFKHYKIDTYICTNNSEKLNELIEDFNPVSYSICEEHGCYKKLNALKLINKEYDYILLTRFDIYFMKEIMPDFDKMNITSILEHKDVCDDNFYFFPMKYLNTFIGIIESSDLKCSSSYHGFIHRIEKSMDVHYLFDEKVRVNNLSMYRLHFFYSLDFIINKFLFTEKCFYQNLHSSIFIENDTIHSKGWLGYEITEANHISLKTLGGKFSIKIKNEIYSFDTSPIQLNVNIKNELVQFISDDIIYKNILIQNITVQ